MIFERKILPPISSRFIREWTIRILKAQALRHSTRKRGIFPAEMSASGSLAIPVVSIGERIKTPELMKTFSPKIAIRQEEYVPRTLLNAPKTSLASKSFVNQKILLDFNKLKEVLSDNSINLIECIGAGKPIFVTRDGKTSESNIVLTDDEINNFMKEVSQKTRIPLASGLFKARIENFIIIAVISEFVGTRFIIQKV